MTAQADTFVRNRLPPPEQMPTLLLDRPEQQWPAQLNVVDWLFARARAQGHAGRPLLRSDERTLSYAEAEAEESGVKFAVVARPRCEPCSSPLLTLLLLTALPSDNTAARAAS